MNPKTKAAPSYAYIPLETTNHDHDSTTKNPINTKSTILDDPTTIITGTKSLEPRNYGGQRKLPPPPPPPRQFLKDVEAVVKLLLGIFVTASFVVCLVRLSFVIKQESKYVPAVDPLVEIKSASVSLLNLSTSTITTKAEVAFIVTKPSDCSVAFYDTIVVSLFHMEKPISVAKIDSFFQNESNNTTIKAMFPTTVAPDVKVNSTLSSELSFDVNAKGRLWQNEWKGADAMGEGRQMNVWCPDVKINVMMETGVGTMAGPAKCKVKTYYD